MRVILEKIAMQDINSVIANTKAEAARAGRWAGFMIGFFTSAIFAVLIALVLLCDGRLHSDRLPGLPPATGPVGVPAAGVVPPLHALSGPSAGVSAPPIGGPATPLNLPPAPAPDQN